MPSTPSQLRTLRPELATFEQLDREMQLRNYVMYQVMPTFTVSEQAGSFGLIKLKSLLANADADTKRTSTGGYNRGEYEFEDRQYMTKENGWEETVDERDEKIYGSYFACEEIATYRAWETVMAGLEARCINTVTGVPAAQQQAAVALWSDYVNAQPIDDVQAAQDAIWLRTGVWPETLTMSKRDYRNLRRCQQITKEIKADGAGRSAEPGVITRQMIAEVLDVKEIVISSVIKNTANRAKDAKIASRWPEGTVALTKSPDNPSDFKSPCFARILHWGGDGSRLAGENLVGVVEEYEEPQTRKRVIRARHETQEFQLYPEMCQLITGVR